MAAAAGAELVISITSCIKTRCEPCSHSVRIVLRDGTKPAVLRCRVFALTAAPNNIY